MKKVIMMFTLLVNAQLSQVGYAAAYDPKPVEYQNVVADNVLVEHDRIMAGVDEFIITGKKGKITEKFRLTCNADEARLDIMYYLKDIYGDKAEGATGMTLQYYPAGAHQMNISIDHPDTLMDSLLAANLAQAVSKMLVHKTGTFVFHFYHNDSSFDHVPLAYSFQYPAKLLAPAMGKALVDAKATSCDIKSGNSQLSPLKRLVDHQ
ncbi:TPA: hypothetical protein PXO57_003618 [Yersinia enterocolitica]|uniref:hypothetical protein n=1 Tax=Yersinia enterocolitica TaxID=630 RepID=UPI0006579F0D|nr:hypothetical protein [Yersinia enterocolitica]CRX41148.1 Uncharacterised protein [Yersinia enterocolitica]HDL6591550.1 hypothetical protein [Yersinia enterocolitica]HDL7593156.1 hypothetical protein [Yersinia enterocolitica]HDL7855793.1 hypothetical protein [Yersinia enterocolitica]